MKTFFKSLNKTYLAQAFSKGLFLKVLFVSFFLILNTNMSYADVSYSPVTITIDDSASEYFDWDNCANFSHIYDTGIVPTSALYYVETSDANVTWVLNETKLQINAGAYMCMDFESLVMDYTNTNIPTIKNYGNLRINNSLIFAESKGVPAAQKKMYRGFSDSVLNVSDSSIHANRQGNLLAFDVQNGNSRFNRTSISGFAKGIVTSSGDVIIDRLTVSDCYEISGSYGIINLISPAVPWTDIVIKGCEVGYETAYEASKAYKVTLKDCGNTADGDFCWDDFDGISGAINHYLIDSDMNWTSIEITDADHTKYQSYTLNLKVKEANKIESFMNSVDCSLYNSDETEAFQVTTDANGEITEQEVNFRKWVNTGTNPVAVDTEFYPFHLNCSKTGYGNLNMSLNYSMIEGRETEGMDLEIAMVPIGDSINQPPTSADYLTVYGTDYIVGENATTYVVLRYGNGTIAPHSSCFVEYRFKNIHWYDDVAMDNDSVTGIKYHDFAIPQNFSNLTIYPWVTCNNPDVNNSGEVRTGIWYENLYNLGRTINQTVNDTWDILQKINATVNETREMGLYWNNTLYPDWNATFVWQNDTLKLINMTTYGTNETIIQINNTVNNIWEITQNINQTVNDTWNTLIFINDTIKQINATVNETRGMALFWNNTLYTDWNLTFWQINQTVDETNATVFYINNTRWNNITANNIYNRINNEIEFLSSNTTEVLTRIRYNKEYLQEAIFLVTDAVNSQQAASESWKRGDVQETMQQLANAKGNLEEANEIIIKEANVLSVNNLLNNLNKSLPAGKAIGTSSSLYLSYIILLVFVMIYFVKIKRKTNFSADYYKQRIYHQLMFLIKNTGVRNK